jgi:hypothetical protein
LHHSLLFKMVKLLLFSIASLSLSLPLLCLSFLHSRSLARSLARAHDQCPSGQRKKGSFRLRAFHKTSSHARRMYEYKYAYKSRCIYYVPKQLPSKSTNRRKYSIWASCLLVVTSGPHFLRTYHPTNQPTNQPNQKPNQTITS